MEQEYMHLHQNKLNNELNPEDSNPENPRDKPERKKAPLTSKVYLNKKDLPSYNNETLESFMFGIYLDNALTYMMRIQNRSFFKYLLGRGVQIIAFDSKA